MQLRREVADQSDFFGAMDGASKFVRGDAIAGVFITLINIFGGILRCDVLAEGVVGAATEMGIEVPLVVRLEGTNVDQGRKILADSGLKIHSAKDMADGVQMAVKLARGEEVA